MSISLCRVAVAVCAPLLLSSVARADDKDDEKPKVNLAVTADKVGVVIEHRVNGVEGWQTTLGVPIYTSTQQWEPVCVAPCNVKVDPNAIFRVGGVGVAPSRDFVLPAQRKELRLQVSAGSGPAYDLGLGLTTTGALFAGIGVIPLVYAGSLTNTSAEETVRGLGVGILGAGVLMLAIGVPLWLLGKSTVFACPDGARIAKSGGALAF